VSPDRIVVQGRARREVDPDAASLRMAVIEIDADRREAFTRCAARVERTVPPLRAAVGLDGDVMTGEASLDRHYDEPDDEGPPRYAASCPLTVECAPVRAADVIAAAVQAGIDELRGPRYWVRQQAPLVEELLGEAVDAARRKAQRIAQAAGRRLGGVIKAEEPDPLYPGYPDDHEFTLAGGPSASHVELQPARVSVAVTVRVAFALGDLNDTDDRP
jgi:uncharacterized protein